MKPIRVEDIQKLTDIVMELPALRDLKSGDMIQDVLDTFLKQIYTEMPKELIDAFGFELNNRMQETFFANYGIDRNYSSKLKGYLKKDIAYQLEKLYQNKGSKQIFRIFADLFENIFRKINFYNVKVFKVPNTSGFTYEYRLVPLYITDTEHIITRPEVPINQSKKYLMELENFEGYTAWPMSTNLVYIQLSIGTEIIDNQNTFLDGVRSFGTTYMQGKYLEYKNNQGFTELLLGSDVELITAYFKTEITKKHNPDWDYDLPITLGTFLPWDPDTIADPNYPEHQQWTQDRESFLQNMQTLMNDYESANIRSRQDMEAIKRRWQMFLKLKETNNNSFPNYQSLVDYMENNYPILKRDFLDKLSIANAVDQNNEPLLDFYIYIYSIFLSGVFSNPENPSLGLNQEIVVDYIDVLFGALFIEADFLKWTFNPVIDLFIKYFLPIEMEYINDLVQKVIIKNKWNAISYDTTHLKFQVIARHFGTQIPIRGVDWKKFWIIVRKHSRFDIKIMKLSIIYITKIEDHLIDDRSKVIIPFYLREDLGITDKVYVEIIKG